MTELGVIDATVHAEDGYREDGSVMLIPKTELIGYTHYTVLVTLADPRPGYTAQASYSFGFTTGRCDICRHLPDQPAGLLGLRPGPGAAFTVSSNGQTEGASFSVSHRRSGVRVGRFCRSGLTVKQQRGHRRCTALRKHRTGRWA